MKIFGKNSKAVVCTCILIYTVACIVVSLDPTPVRLDESQTETITTQEHTGEVSRHVAGDHLPSESAFSLDAYTVPELVKAYNKKENPVIPKYIIYRCWSECGGLGKRLVGMINAYLWSLVTNRTLLFDLRHPCSTNLNGLLIPNLVKWNDSTPITSSDDSIIIDAIDDITISSVISSGRLEKKFNKKFLILHSNMQLWHSFFTPTSYNLILKAKGYVDQTDWGVFRKAFYDLFKWSTYLKHKLFIFRQQGINGKTSYKHTPMVCGEILTGMVDDLSNDPPKYLQGSVKKQLLFLSDMQKDYDHASIFITSDLKHVMGAAKQQFGASNLQLSILGSISNKKASKNVCVKQERELLNLLILSKCDYVQVRSDLGILATYLQEDESRVSMIHNGRYIAGPIPALFLDSSRNRNV